MQLCDALRASRHANEELAAASPDATTQLQIEIGSLDTEDRSYGKRGGRGVSHIALHPDVFILGLQHDSLNVFTLETGFRPTLYIKQHG